MDGSIVVMLRTEWEHGQDIDMGTDLKFSYVFPPPNDFDERR